MLYLEHYADSLHNNILENECNKYQRIIQNKTVAFMNKNNYNTYQYYI